MKESAGQSSGLVGPNIGEESEAVARKDFDGGYAAHIAPPGAVGGGPHAGVVVGGEAGGGELGAAGEGEVVGGEAFFGEGGGGDDENGAVAEAEAEDRAVSGRESGQGLVEGFFEEVEVAEYGTGIGRAWREILVVVVVGYQEFGN